MKNNIRPKVSVVINCFNGRKFLHQSILSVINQTYNNWEIIFFDNKSTDDSIKIVKSFKDKRIKIFKSKSFIRLYNARNLAIKNCKGDYICFLDSDDTWNSKKLEIQINFMKKNKLKFSYSNYNIIYQKKKKIKRAQFINKKKYFPSTQELINNYNLAILTVMIDSSIFKLRKFNNKYDIIGDFDLFMDLSFTTKIGYLNRPLANYRLHNTNLSITKLDQHVKELIDWLLNNKKKYVSKKIKLYNFYILLFKLSIRMLINKLIGRVVQW